MRQAPARVTTAQAALRSETTGGYRFRLIQRLANAQGGEKSLLGGLSLWQRTCLISCQIDQKNDMLGSKRSPVERANLQPFESFSGAAAQVNRCFYRHRSNFQFASSGWTMT